MPYANRDDLLRHWRERQRRRRVAQRERKQQERLLRERQVELKASGRVPMALRWELVFDDRTYPVNSVIHVLPGEQHWWERKGLATPVPSGEPVTCVRVITSLPPEVEPPKPPKERTAAGY